jgi:hypothetical protein
MRTPPDLSVDLDSFHKLFKSNILHPGIVFHWNIVLELYQDLFKITGILTRTGTDAFSDAIHFLFSEPVQQI